jgi:hypothetical protein
MSFTRIVALSLALMFVTTVGLTAFAPAAHATRLRPPHAFDAHGTVTPDQRLANPKFIPQASSRGRAV